jgi:hypothetical protein
VVARQPEKLDLFVSADTGDVYTCSWSKGSDWSSVKGKWTNLGGRFHRKSAAANVAAISRGSETLDIFFCGDSGEVWSKCYTKETGWYCHWKNLGSLQLRPGGFIAAVSRRTQQIDLFTCGNDGQVYTSWWRKGDPDWSGIRRGWRCLDGHFKPGTSLSVVAPVEERLEAFVIGKDGFTYNAW